jgi:hypothetical protein
MSVYLISIKEIAVFHNVISKNDIKAASNIIEAIHHFPYSQVVYGDFYQKKIRGIELWSSGGENGKDD